MSIVSLFERSFSEYKVERCKEGEDELVLEEFPDRKIIIKIDKMKLPKKEGKRCDFMIAVDEEGSEFLLPIEFKSKSLKLGEIKKKLEGGIKIFRERKGLPDQFRCYPVLASKSLGTGQRKELRKIRVEFNGGQATIKHRYYSESLNWGEVSEDAV